MQGEIVMRRVKSECEKQFFKNNKTNFIGSIISLVLVAVLNVLLAFILQFFIEAVEFRSHDILIKGK